MSNQQPKRRRGLLLLIVFTSGLFACVAGVVLLLINAYGIERVTAEWAQIRPYVVAAKWSAMLLAVIRWPSLARWLGQRFGMAPEEVRRLEGMRWRLAAALIVLELFLGQNLIGRLTGAA